MITLPRLSFQRFAMISCRHKRVCRTVAEAAAAATKHVTDIDDAAVDMPLCCHALRCCAPCLLFRRPRVFERALFATFYAMLHICLAQARAQDSAIIDFHAMMPAAALILMMPLMPPPPPCRSALFSFDAPDAPPMAPDVVSRRLASPLRC